MVSLGRSFFTSSCQECTAFEVLSLASAKLPAFRSLRRCLAFLDHVPNLICSWKARPFWRVHHIRPLASTSSAIRSGPKKHRHTITQDLTRLCNANIKTQCPNTNSPSFFPVTADILLPLKSKTYKQNSSLNCRTHTTTDMRAKTLKPKTSPHSEKAMEWAK